MTLQTGRGRSSQEEGWSLGGGLPAPPLGRPRPSARPAPRSAPPLGRPLRKQEELQGADVFRPPFPPPSPHPGRTGGGAGEASETPSLAPFQLQGRRESSRGPAPCQPDSAVLIRGDLMTGAPHAQGKIMRPLRGCSRKQNTEQKIIPGILGQYIKVQQEPGCQREASVGLSPPREEKVLGLLKCGAPCGKGTPPRERLCPEQQQPRVFWVWRPR